MAEKTSIKLVFFEGVTKKEVKEPSEEVKSAILSMTSGNVSIDESQFSFMKYQGFNPLDYSKTVIADMLAAGVSLNSLALLAATGALIGNKKPTDKFDEKFRTQYDKAVNDIVKFKFTVTYSEPKQTDVTPARLMICFPGFSIRARIQSSNFCQVVYQPTIEDMTVSGISTEAAKKIIGERWAWFTVMPAFLNRGKNDALIRLYHIIAIRTTEILRRKRKETSEQLRNAFAVTQSILETQIGSQTGIPLAYEEVGSFLSRAKGIEWDEEDQTKYDEYVEKMVERLAPKKDSKSKSKS